MDNEENEFSRFLDLKDSDELSLPENFSIDTEQALASISEQSSAQPATQETGASEEIVQDSISRLSENVREEAVEIARDILNKLKITLGNALLEDGIHLKFLDKEDILGMLNQVTDVWEYLLASARAMDEKLLENAVVYNAVMAMDRMQHALMADQLTRANQAGDINKATQLSGKMENMPQHAKNMSGTFGELLNKIDKGMQLIMQQLQQRGTPDTMADNWRGLTNYNTINGRDTQDDQREKRNAKSMEHIEQRQELAARKAAHMETQLAGRQGQQQSSREGQKQDQQKQQQNTRDNSLRARFSKFFSRSNWLGGMRNNLQAQQQQAQIQTQINIRHVAKKNLHIQQERMNDVRREQSQQRQERGEQRKDGMQQKQDLQSLDAQLADVKRDAHNIADVDASADPSKDKKDLDPTQHKKFTDRFR